MENQVNGKEQPLKPEIVNLAGILGEEKAYPGLPGAEGLKDLAAALYK